MIKVTLVLISSLIFIGSCRKKEVLQNKNNNNTHSATLNIDDWRREILDVDSVLINGAIPIITTKENIFKILGPPKNRTKISSNSGFLPYLKTDSLSKAYRIYYGETFFDEIENVAILNTLDFRSTNVQLVHPLITLKGGLTVIELSKIFPESCKLITLSGNSWSGHIELHTSNKGLDPRRWFLIFQNEQLVKIILFTFN